MGGTLATGAAVCSAFYAHSRRLPEASRNLLTNSSGPFALPEGFEAIIIGRAGERLSDGARSPASPDGMACFADGDHWILLRNHEIDRAPERGAYPAGQPDLAYDRNGHGGVSRLVIDPKTLRVLSSNMVLTGTLRNCAGGPSPWGWMSCEETTEPGHGYTFLCRTEARALSKPEKLADFGRFRHEAVAFDPDTGQAYLTEDEADGCLYRFSPRDRKAPFAGRLEALRLIGQHGISTGALGEPGSKWKVDWVTIDDPDATREPTRTQALRKGAATFVRGEGAWLDGDGMVFCATAGGRAGRGQIFRLSFAPNELVLVAESTSDDDFNAPDNITVAPWGDFIVAEDGQAPQHLFGIRRDGSCYPLLRNEKSSSELAGVSFSPDGSVLFCNAQWDGLTVAVRGPFREFFEEPWFVI